MKIKNGQVAQIVLALQEIVQMPVEVRTGMKIRKLARLINAQADDMEAERLRLLEQHAQCDANGEKILRSDLSYAVDDVFFTKIQELLDLEFEAEPLTVADLAGIGAIKPVTLLGLGDLLIEGEVQ